MLISSCLVGTESEQRHYLPVAEGAQGLINIYAKLQKTPLMERHKCGCLRILYFPDPQTSLRKAGCTKLGHWMRVTLMASTRANCGILVMETDSALPQPVRAFVRDSVLCEQCTENSHFNFSSLFLVSVTEDWQEGEAMLEKESCYLL